MSKNISTLVEALAKPIVEENNLILWDVEYLKEGSAYYLRIYIDKEDGASINDCETISRALDEILDESDIIEDSYYLEVCTAGLERSLTKDWHFEKYLDSEITLKLYKPLNGSKTLVGVLKDYSENTITICSDENIENSINKKDCAAIKLFFKI